MAVPKKKTTPSRQGMRRAHDGLAAVHASKCSNCGNAKLSHHMCLSCGHYKGRFVLEKSALEAPAE